MIQNVRRISLFVLIVFTLSTLFFQVINVTYAENDDNSDLEERVEKLEEIVKEQGEQIEQLKNPDRTAVGVAKDIVLTGVGTIGVVGGALAAVTGDVMESVPFVGQVPGTVVSAVGVGTMVGSGIVVVDSGGNLLSDVGNVASSIGNGIGAAINIVGNKIFGGGDEEETVPEP